METAIHLELIRFMEAGIRMMFVRPVYCRSIYNPLHCLSQIPGCHLKLFFQIIRSQHHYDQIQRIMFAPAYPEPEILIVSSILIKPGISDSIYGCFTEEAAVMSQCFRLEYEAVAKRKTAISSMRLRLQKPARKIGCI